MTDFAGHRQDPDLAGREIYKIEALIYEVAGRITGDNTVLIVTSDHGNLEDLRTKSHTLNKSFFACWGADEKVLQLRKLTDIEPFVQSLLNSYYLYLLYSGDGGACVLFL